MFLGQGSSWYIWYTPPDCDCWHIQGIWQSHYGRAAFLGNQWGRGHLIADYYKNQNNRLGTLVLACAATRAWSVLQTAHSIHPMSLMCLRMVIMILNVLYFFGFMSLSLNTSNHKPMLFTNINVILSTRITLVISLAHLMLACFHVFLSFKAHRSIECTNAIN